MEIDLLRSTKWLKDHGAHVGGTIFLDMPEMGACGDAEVLAIKPCPPAEVGPGRLVTGTFRHTAGEVYDLKLASEAVPLGETAGHPFWSCDRGTWVAAIDLRIGETLKTLTGTTVVESMTRRSAPEPVYNIEVEGDHVYRVGNSGVLVHNSSANPCPANTEYDPHPMETVTFQGQSIERATGVVALIARSNYARSNFGSNFPSWWSAFTTANPVSGRGWRKGHLLGSQFGGPADKENLAPQPFLVNNSAIQQCDNRIKEALACGCVLFEINVNYGTNALAPESFRIRAENNAGFNLDVTVQNVANPTVPTQCQRS